MGDVIRIFSIFLSFLVIISGSVSCSKDEKARKVPVARKSISADTITARSMTLPFYREFSGMVVPKVEVRLAAKAPGYVKEVLVREGRRVETGQVLIRLDEKDLHWQVEGLKKKKTALEEERKGLLQDFYYAKANYERIERLFNDEAATRDEYDRAKAAFLGGKARLAAYDARIHGVSARINALRNELTYRIIKSPVTGWVVRRHVDPGTFVGPGAPLLELASVAHGFRFVAHVPESMLDKVRAGDTAYIMIGHVRSGRSNWAPQETKITQVVPEVDPATHTLEIKADLAGSGYRKGMYGTIWLEAGKRTGILLPDSVILSRGGLEGIYAVDRDGVIYFQVITTAGCYYKEEAGLFPCEDGGRGEKTSVPGTSASSGPAREKFLLVSSGVTAGMKVCASRLHEIKEGMSLE